MQDPFFLDILFCFTKLKKINVHEDTAEASHQQQEKTMKSEIHPEYHRIIAKCACGNEMEVGTVNEEIKVEICSSCHPFFTGKQKLVDTAGRVEKFLKKYGRTLEK